MEWFMLRSLRKLPGIFKPAFWNTLLPQATFAEPAVLHAVLTLGSVHKRQALTLESDAGTPLPPTRDPSATEFFALHHYTRAASHLRRRIDEKAGSSTDVLSTRVALITCAIFVHLEHLRGCYQTALTHLRHGLVLLENLLRHIDGHDRTEADYSGRPGRDEMVDEWLTQTFSTLFVQAKLFGQAGLVGPPRLLSLLSGHRAPVHVGEAFPSADHARQDLEYILLRIFGLASSGQEQTCRCLEPAPSSPTHRDHLLSSLQIELDVWLSRAGDETDIAPGGQPVVDGKQLTPASAVERFAWKLLREYHTLACVMLAECTASSSVVSVASSTPTKTDLPWPTVSHPSPDASSASSKTVFSHSISPTSTSAFSTSLRHSTGSGHAQPHSTDDDDSPSETTSNSSSPFNSSDPLTPLYRSIVAQCRHLYKLAFGPSVFQSTWPDGRESPPDPDNARAIAEMGWIPPLYHVAVYARDLDVRREAVQLLRFAPHREGIWDSSLAAAVAERILDVERRANDDLHDASLTPDRVREQPQQPQQCVFVVKDVQVQLPEGPDGILSLNYTLHRHDWTQDARHRIQGRSTYGLRSSCWVDEECH
jgi:hypothetical protein